MRYIVAGSREFGDSAFLYAVMDALLAGDQSPEIVSGGARGADTLGEHYAANRGIPLKVFPADWSQHGKSAGHRRNQQMAEYGHVLVAFWVNKSTGTRDMINRALDQRLRVHVFQFPAK